MPPSPIARTRPAGSIRVPEITAYFWILKGLSTAMGESTSDFLVHRLGPVPAVLMGFAAFSLALVRQLRTRSYRAWNYWTAVTMVGVFGTMVADVVHIGMHVPYVASMIFFAIVLAGIFIIWSKRQGTLSIHSIDSIERELFYWAAVVATFALGTAAGDFTAITLHLGYLSSIVLFASVITIPAIGFGLLRWNAIFSFWSAYVVTRPLGASIADALGKPKSLGGVGIGSGWVALVLTLAIASLVAYLARTHRDVQRAALVSAPTRTTGVPAYRRSNDTNRLHDES